MARMFGTDGVRGVAGKELTGELAYKLGQAGATALTSSHSPRILIGRDTRLSGQMLESALAAGICSAGAEAVLCGVLPTPAIAYLTRTCGFDAGVVISASHNSYEFNGIKFFNKDGYKLSDSVEDEIEKLVKSGIENASFDKIGKITDFSDGAEKYINFAISTCEGDDLDGLKVIIDCANGASGKVAAQALAELGCDVIVTGNDDNGISINDGCGSTHLEQLSELVKAHKGYIGIAFDGDADRMLAVNENGNIVDGDKIMLICAIDMKERGCLKNDKLVVTVMSNLGLWIASEENGISLEKTAVGDRYVLENMLANGYNLGGEQSGHMIFLDHNTTGDGLVSAIQLLSVIKRSSKTLSELAEVMRTLPQVLVNARIDSPKRREYMQDPDIAAAISSIEEKYNGKGRVLIRLSGTEPLVRVMLEGEDLNEMQSDANALAELMIKKLS